MTAHYFEMQLCIFSGEGGGEVLELHAEASHHLIGLKQSTVTIELYLHKRSC